MWDAGQAAQPEPRGLGTGLGSWLSERGLLAGDGEETAEEFAEFAAVCWPQAAAGPRATLARWSAICFLVDDTLDCPVADAIGASQALAPDRLADHLSVLFRHPLHLPSGRADGLLGAFDEVWQCIAGPMSLPWRRRFLWHCLDYLDATAWEARNRSSGLTPIRAEYLHYRRRSSGSGAHLDLVEYAGGCGLPETLRSRPLVRTTLTAAADIAAWHNDLVSLSKEATAGDPNNLVLVLAQEKDCDVARAVDLVRDQLHDRLGEFDRTSRRLQHTSSPVTARYTEGLRAWVSGTLAWNTAARRYRSPQSGAAATSA